MKRRSAKNGQYRADGIYERVDEQIENLVRLINDMLDSSRIQSGNLVLRTKRFDLDSMIAEVIRDVETFTNSGGSVTGRPFRFVFTEKAGCSVVGDRYRLAQVVTNLLTNAIKYSDTSRTITIMTRKTGSGVQVCVRDNGIGIPADKLNHIFERFYRVSENSGLQGRFTSLGLGLYISVNIIRQHGGVMNVKSRLGEGSEFSFYLPLRRQHNAQRTGRVRHAGSAIVHP